MPENVESDQSEDAYQQGLRDQQVAALRREMAHYRALGKDERAKGVAAVLRGLRNTAGRPAPETRDAD